MRWALSSNIGLVDLVAFRLLLKLSGENQITLLVFAFLIIIKSLTFFFRVLIFQDFQILNRECQLHHYFNRLGRMPQILNLLCSFLSMLVMTLSHARSREFFLGRIQCQVFAPANFQHSKTYTNLLCSNLSCKNRSTTEWGGVIWTKWRTRVRLTNVSFKIIRSHISLLFTELLLYKKMQMDMLWWLHISRFTSVILWSWCPVGGGGGKQCLAYFTELQKATSNVVDLFEGFFP